VVLLIDWLRLELLAIVRSAVVAQDLVHLDFWLDFVLMLAV
jgi:hypothetical protein